MFGMFGGAKTRFSVTDAVAGLAQGTVTVIDVREVAEVRASGTAAGGLHIPLAMLALKADPRAPDHDPRLDPSRPVAVFCASGGRSGMAAQLLGRLGYEAHNIGGFGDWCAAGGPVVR